jgi:hypothetical protein
VTLPLIDPLKLSSDYLFSTTTITSSSSDEELEDHGILSESLFNQAGGDDDHNKWYSKLVSKDMIQYALKMMLYGLVMLLTSFARMIATPTTAFFEFSLVLIHHMLPLIVLYGVLIVVMGLLAVLIQYVQSFFLKINFIFMMAIKPFVFVYEKISLLFTGFLNFILRRKSGSSKETNDISGDEMREEFRARKAAKSSSHASVRNQVQFFQPGEKNILYFLLASFIGLHVKSLQPTFLLRGVLSMDSSFTDEVHVFTMVVLSANLLLWLSFLVLPSNDSEQAK